ncbi:MAG TPA: hypothetical protein VII73_13620 [Caulobacteraceae bacterium]
MTADEEDLAMQLLRRIDASLDFMRLDLSELGRAMMRCIAILDRINGGPELADATL